MKMFPVDIEEFKRGNARLRLIEQLKRMWRTGEPKCRTCEHLSKPEYIETGAIEYFCLHSKRPHIGDGAVIVTDDYYGASYSYECPLVIREVVEGLK